ncbi:immunoglobulin-like domain-containing protein [Listeria riparia]|uniref:Bacterial Ig domain-containing protein n=1 Tax=Listeria riparia FSL S10-1204 TaxID=1265816 RepID=W7DA29_9LIST|nr:immunoglobulin-like domain-containing protein [Listeria riparia]EUJ44346.1 hypothetical protein PRIP_10632 [Listeria riparia FSL S10-1204]
MQAKIITSINDSVTVVAYDANGKELDRANVPLKKEAATTGTITANTFTIGKDGYVTGSYTGDVKKLSLLVNGKKLGTINATGTPYKYYAGKNITSTNDSVTVVAYDANGKELDRANVPLKKEAATTGTITANTFTIGQDSYVKGNLTGDVAKVKMLVNGKSYVTISASGTSYQYYASGKILSAKDAVTMIAYDTNGKELDRANVPVKEAMTTGTITANTFTIGKDGYVKGNVTGDVSRVKMIINGVSYPVIGVTGSNYQYYANGKILSNNDAVTMVAYDNKGKELARTNVSVVKENVPTTGTITANKFTIGKDGYITGNLTGDVAKIKMVVDGKSSTLVAAKEGAYKYYAGGKIASVNDAVTMIAYDAKGNELDRANVPLAENSVPVGTVTAEAYTIGSGYIHGTYTGDASRIGVLVNGKEISRINATTSPYQYYVGSQVTSTNDDVYVVIYDNKGREMDRVKVPVQAKVNPTAGTITANPFSIGKDSYVKGSFTGDVARIAMLVNGTEYSRIPANGGEYQYYASGKILSASDNVTMVAYDAKGKELDRAVVSVTAPQGTIAVDAYQVGGSDAYIHGTATGDVKKVQLIVNGAEQGVAFVQADGTFKYYAKAVTSPSDQAVIVALDERGRELDRKTVTLTNATGTVKADTFTVGGSDRYIHGTATGAVTKVGIEVNGVVGTSQAFVQADGTYKYFAGSQIGSSSDVVYVIGYDGKSKEIARTPLSLQSN